MVEILYTESELNTIQARYPAMAEEDAFLVDDVEGGLCVDNTDAGIDGRFNSGSNKDKGSRRTMTTYAEGIY
ncbi:hypothetical protein Tco_0379826 [Tanacetum coccineum]